jgi:hypothetical protein
MALMATFRFQFSMDHTPAQRSVAVILHVATGLEVDLVLELDENSILVYSNDSNAESAAMNSDDIGPMMLSATSQMPAVLLNNINAW